MIKPIKFKLKPDKRKFDSFFIDNAFYFEVYIFENREDMRQYWRKRFKGQGDDNFAGLCINQSMYKIQEDGTELIHPRIGFLLLNKERLGSGLISHECCHAAFQYDRLLGNTNAVYGEQCKDAEERFAYIQGDLVKNIVDKLYKYDIL